MRNLSKAQRQLVNMHITLWNTQCLPAGAGESTHTEMQQCYIPGMHPSCIQPADMTLHHQEELQGEHEA
jgi:hypothetical protein